MNIFYPPSPSPFQHCVATIGFFDWVHQGHRYLIELLKRYAAAHGMASLIITFDAHPRQVMQSDYQPQLLTTLQEKCQLLATTGADGCAILHFTPQMAGLSAYDFMQTILARHLHVKALLIGHDHRFGHNRAEGFSHYVQYGQQLGIEVIQAQALTIGTDTISSSAIRTCLAQGDVSTATRWLTTPYTLTGQVVDGFHIGRTLGYPTANLHINEQENKMIPAQGVYAVWVSGLPQACGRAHMGMLNIGTCPTIGHATQTTIEVHILHLHENLYGTQLTIHFVQRIRGEQLFASRDALMHQLALDEEATIQILNHHPLSSPLCP